MKHISKTDAFRQLTAEQVIAGWKLIGVSPDEALSLELRRKEVEKLEFFIKATPESAEALASLPVNADAARHLAAVAMERLVSEFFVGVDLAKAIQGIVDERLPRMAEAAISRTIQSMDDWARSVVTSEIRRTINSTISAIRIDVRIPGHQQ